MKLPDKFEMCTKGNPLDKFILTKGANNEHYVMRKLARSIDDAYDAPVGYSVEFVEAAVENGDWTITKDLTERELVLPLTVQHKDGEIYYILKGSDEGRATFIDDNGHVDENYWTYQECRAFIEEGIWTVKSVGPQKPVEAPPSGDSDKLELSIELDAKDALEAVNDLVASLQHLEVVYKRVQCLFNQ